MIMINFYCAKKKIHATKKNKQVYKRKITQAHTFNSGIK